MDVHLNQNCTLLQNLSVRLGKQMGETKIPQSSLTFSYGIDICVKSGVQYYLKISAFHL